MERLKLYWLGAPRVELTDQIVKLETRKAAALLCYLSLTPGHCPREILAAMFWPEGSQQKALANLRRTLSSLNASLPGWIEIERGSLALKRNDNLSLDVDDFLQLLIEIEQHVYTEKEACEECLPLLERTAELVRGEFLEGLNLTDAPGFDEWQFFQRDGLRQKFALALQQISIALAQRSQWERAITYARRWVALDRLHEPAQRALIDLYIRSGQRVAALRQYEEFVRLIKEELGQEPEEETRQLYEQIRRREEAKRVVEVPGDPSSFPLLKTKLYIPVAPASRVVRTHLIERLGEAERKALTIISAPAGFGKTTLLAEWIAQTALPVAWLSLDNGDNDPYRFLSYLITALESVQEGVGTEAGQLMRSYQLVPAHIILASLLNDMGKVADPYVLILDDYQFISEHIVHETVAYLLDHIPTNMHIVIATRADPPLQLGRLRAHEQMLELRTQDLRFTPEEVTAFLNEVMRLELSAEDIEALETRTEGWVVGLKMAALSLKGHENASKFIEVFSGSHRYVLDYLVEEVLKRQSARIQAFLLHASILDKLSGALCDALMTDEWRQTGENSQAILEYLEHNNLFLISLDDERIWYRYHHLFADLLYARLKQTFKAHEIAAVHKKAAQWYQDNGLTYEAIHHASLTSNNEWVEQLIEQNYMEMFHRGEASSMRFWTGKLSKELIHRRPWLCIYEAQSHALFGQLDEADILLAKAEKHLQLENPAADTKSILGHLAYIKSRVTGMRGDVHQAIELSLTARENTPVSNHALQSGIGVMLGVGYFLNGDFTDAIQTFSETIQSGIAANAINGTVAAYCHLARLYAIQGQLHKSYELYQEAGKFAREAGGQNRGVMSLVHMGIANILYELNDLENALTHIKHGLELIPLWGNADDIVLAYTTHARIQQAQGNKAGAVEAIEKGIHLIQTKGVFSAARDAVRTAQVKLWLVQGDLQAANCWAESLQERLNWGNPFRFENELAHIAQARVFIAQNQAIEAIDLLSHLEEIARSAGRMGRVIEILLLKALAIQKIGDSEHALLALTECLRLAEPEGYMRVFLDEGEMMGKLLMQLSKTSLNTSNREYVDRLLGAFALKEKIMV